MTTAQTKGLRSLALTGPAGCGKTSLAEAILFNCGAIERIGDITHGTTLLDFEPEEIQRKMSISSSVASCTWKDQKLQIVDTPGCPDFLEDTRLALSAVDGAVFVLGGVSGIKPEGERIWKMLEQAGLPRIVFLSEIDKEQSSFKATLEQFADIYGVKPAPISIPLGEGAALSGVIDLIEMKAHRKRNVESSVSEIPSEASELAKESRKIMVEALAESDDTLLETYLDRGDLTLEEIQKGLLLATVSRRCVPLFCGSTVKNIGIRRLMNGIVWALPSPADRARLVGINGRSLKTQLSVKRDSDPNGPLTARVFKTVNDPFLGHLSYVRVFSGTLKSNAPFFNATRNLEEKGGHTYTAQGKKYTPVHDLMPGDIGAIAKLKDTRTGDTLAAPEDPIVLDGSAPDQPTYSVAVVPKNRDDDDKVSQGLLKIVEEDPGLAFVRDAESHEQVLSARGQLHLDVTMERLKRKYGADVALHPPTVKYRETIRGKSEAQGRYKKQSGGHGHFADAWITLEPSSQDERLEFVDAIVGGAIPRGFIAYVHKGIQDAMREGSLARFPVVGIKATLFDGSYHTVDSAGPDFEFAGTMAFRKGMAEARPVLLEPIMEVVITAPEDAMGAVLGDLNSRRARIRGMGGSGRAKVIEADVPHAELLKYTVTLTSLTAGRGSFTMTFARYEDVPPDLSQKIVQERKSGPVH